MVVERKEKVASVCSVTIYNCLENTKITTPLNNSIDRCKIHTTKQKFMQATDQSAEKTD